MTMTPLDRYIQTLQHAADALIALRALGLDTPVPRSAANETPHTANAIRAHAKLHVNAVTRRARVRLHWTQTPKGKAKLSRAMRASWHRRDATAKGKGATS